MLVYGQASNARLLGKQGYLTVDVLYKNHYGFLHIQEVLLDTVNPTTILRKIKIFLLSTPDDKNKQNKTKLKKLEAFLWNVPGALLKPLDPEVSGTKAIPVAAGTQLRLS